jgi:hypothetical protein
VNPLGDLKQHLTHPNSGVVHPKLSPQEPNLIFAGYNVFCQTRHTIFRREYDSKLLLRCRKSTPFIKPQQIKSYVLRSSGFFLVGKVFKALIQFTPRFNKRIHSFLFPNEVKNKLLRKRKKIKYQSSVFKLRNKLKRNRFFSYKALNSSYKSFLLAQADLKIVKLSFGLSNTDKLPSSNVKIGYKDSCDNIVDSEYFYNKGLSISFKRMEIHIPRVRFRPGYQRI